MCEYSVRRNLGLLLNSLAGGRALSVHGGRVRSARAIAAIDTGNREENREVIPRLCRQKGLNPYEAKELGRR